MYLHTSQRTLFPSQMDRSIWKQRCLTQVSDQRSMPDFLYHELVDLHRSKPSFAQFGSELDDDTKERLDQGERIKEILKQPQYQPLAVEKQVVIIYAAVKKHLLDLAVDQILDFQKELFDLIDTKYPEIFTSIAETKVMDDATEEKLIKAINEAKESFRK